MCIVRLEHGAQFEVSLDATSRRASSIKAKRKEKLSLCVRLLAFRTQSDTQTEGSIDYGFKFTSSWSLGSMPLQEAVDSASGAKKNGTC